MIIVNIKNGLGNQMFQYAFGKVLEWKYGESVWFDLMRDENDNSPMISDLDVFQIEKILEADQKMVQPFKPFSVAYYRINKKCILYIYFKIRRMIQPNRLITERFPGKYSRYFNTLRTNKNYYFLGFWQNASYYFSYEERIRNLFQPKDKSVFESEIAKEISDSNFDTISLHIRRGDYLNAGFIEPASSEYLNNAIRFLKAKLTNPYIYVFTDEAQWIKDNFKTDLPYKLIEGNTGNNSYKDIILMSLCKYNIIANSSFSWWGGWLNKNPEKIVIAPMKWYASPDRDRYSACITPKEWIRL